MNFRLIAYLVSALVFFLGLSMCLPLIIGLIYNDNGAWPLFLSLAVTSGVGGCVLLWTRGHQNFYLSHRDGMMIVALGWIISGLLATLPYLFSGAIPGFTDAYFESMSGFTTTGASILTNIEILPPSILFWRAQTQWLGGMGIIVLSVAILPFLGIGGMQLYKAETPSPVVDKLTPRISDTAKLLWKIYFFLTVFQILLLLIGGMSLYDSVYHSFTTMPTGGFSPKNASVGHYQSTYIDFVILTFMFLAGINFTMHYKLVRGNVRQFFVNPEFLAYLSIAGLFIFLVFLDVYSTIYPRILDAFRYASFQVVSILTTTGFVTADYEKWPAFSQAILFVCMFLGGMAGSTGGGIKIMRIILMLKHCYLEIFRIIHPHATTMVKLGNVPVSQTIMRSIWGFFLLYMGIFILGVIALAGLGMDMISALSAMATCLGNVGPGLGSIGPMDNFAGVHPAGKWIMIFAMLLGRLEIYTIIVLLMPAFWRK
jgi:trk system potassium uptake protein TrkH